MRRDLSSTCMRQVRQVGIYYLHETDNIELMLKFDLHLDLTSLVKQIKPKFFVTYFYLFIIFYTNKHTHELYTGVYKYTMKKIALFTTKHFHVRNRW